MGKISLIAKLLVPFTAGACVAGYSTPETAEFILGGSKRDNQLAPEAGVCNVASAAFR